MSTEIIQPAAKCLCYGTLVAGAPGSTLYILKGAPNSIAHLRGMKLANVGAVSSIFLYHLPAGVSVATLRYCFISSLIMQAAPFTYEFAWERGEFVLGNGDSILALAGTANQISASLYGEEQL